MAKKPEKLHVLHVALGPAMRGGERQALQLHKALLHRGIDSTLVCRKGSELAKQHPQHCTAMSWLGEWDPSALFSLIRNCKLNNAAVIHCHDAHALAQGSLAGNLMGVPVVYTRRVVFPIRSSLLSKAKYKSCSAIIAVSEAVAEQCRHVVPPHSVHIIGDGADLSKTMLTRAEARHRLGIRDNEFVVGTVAHFTKEKDFTLVFYAADLLQARNKKERLVCIGPYEKDHKRNKTIPNSLLLTGALDNAVEYYAAFDAYISTSAQEGLGSALLDAVVRDIPSIAVDGGGTKDLYADRSSLVAKGDYQRFGDTLINLIDNFGNAQTIAHANGKHAREKFGADLIADKTIEVYKSLHG